MLSRITTGDNLAEVLRLQPLWNISARLQTKLHKNTMKVAVVSVAARLK
jgi:hypothetical protein